MIRIDPTLERAIQNVVFMHRFYAKVAKLLHIFKHFACFETDI